MNVFREVGTGMRVVGPVVSLTLGAEEMLEEEADEDAETEAGV
jgi:hypothetical protein